MDNNELDQDLKQLFQRVEPIGTSLQDQILTSIEIEKKTFKKERLFMKRKVSFLVIIGMLIATTGFAAVKYQSLINEEGKILYEQKPITSHPSTRTEEESKRIHRMNEVWVNQLKPGEAGIIYIASNNPNRVLDLKGNAHQITSYSTLKDMVKVAGKSVPKGLSGSKKYDFKNGKVNMEFEFDLNKLSDAEKTEITNKLHTETQVSGKDYAIMPVPYGDDFWLATLNYANGKDEISLRIIKSKGGVTGSYDENLNVTSNKINIKGQEAIEIISGDYHELTWAFEEPNTEYVYLYTLGGDKNSAKEMIQIAQNMISPVK